jgi:hypothetical protein
MYNVPAPIQVYDAVHAEASQHPAEGLLMHLAREVDGGFQVIEVWESKEQCDRYSADVLIPIISRVAGPDAAQGPAPEEFEVHELMVPPATTG